MELLTRAIGPVATNVYVLADGRTREAIAIDTARPCLDWIRDELRERGWRLRLIVATHGHWDHIGDIAAVQALSREQAERGVGPIGRAPSADEAGLIGAGGPDETARSSDNQAEIAVHPFDRDRLLHPRMEFAPFEIVPSVPAVDLIEGGSIRFGEIRLEVLHTPGHTEGSVCLLAADAGILFSGDTLFASGWGRTDLPGGSDEQIVESLIRLSSLDDRVRVLPGHGRSTAIGRERSLLELIAATRRLPA